MAWDSVIRQFEIIGEATKHLIQTKILSDKHRVIVDFRNLLIHHYFGIDPEEVFNVAKKDLPEFKKEIIEYILRIPTELRNELIDVYTELNKHLDFVIDALNSFRD